jgi:hypothetical protein
MTAYNCLCLELFERKPWRAWRLCAQPLTSIGDRKTVSRKGAKSLRGWRASGSPRRSPRSRRVGRRNRLLSLCVLGGFARNPKRASAIGRVFLAKAQRRKGIARVGGATKYTKVRIGGFGELTAESWRAWRLCARALTGTETVAWATIRRANIVRRLYVESDK